MGAPWLELLPRGRRKSHASTWRARAVRAGLVLGVLALGGCALREARVTRMADGAEYDARPISPDAYAAYSHGALLEAEGQDRAALEAYQQALEEDPDSAEILARIGAVSCGSAKNQQDKLARRAELSFRRALEQDPESASAWHEIALCAERQGRLKDALTAAERGVEADPRSVSLALEVAGLAEKTGDLNTARIWLDSVAVSHRESREAWRALAAFAARHRDPGRALRAAEGLNPQQSASPSGELVAAIGARDLRRARAFASNLRLSPGELACRLAAQGAADLAREQAALVLGADPDDANAWVAALVAADLSRDPSAFELLARSAPSAPSALSPTAQVIYGALLERRLGPSARLAWQAALHPQQ